MIEIVRGTLGFAVLRIYDVIGDSLDLPVFTQGCSATETGNTANTKVSTGDAAGAVQLTDCVWAAGGEALTLDALNEAFTTTKSIDLTNDTMCVTFTPPGSGLITQIKVLRHYSGNTDTTSARSLLLRLYDDTSDTLLDSLDTTISYSYAVKAGATVAQSDLLDTAFQIHAGVAYRLEVQLPDSGCTYSLSASVTPTALLTPGASVTLSHSFSAPGAGGLFLARYSVYGNGGELSVTIDGETQTPYQTRTVTTSAGEFLEAEFRFDREIPADTEATLKLDCADDGELYLYQWQGTLL